tara:strand:- start:1835 stop:2245 length:411 start_codon:yes stop_codon:yes gene_type:complete
MSIKQNQHNEHYHITQEEDIQNIELIEDEEDELCSKLSETVVDEANQIIAVLETITSELKDISPALIQEAVNQFLTPEDKQEMVDLYLKCFDELPNNNEIKLYVLHLMNDLCIPITRLPKDDIEEKDEGDGNTYLE